jgi:hypothetical protein
MFNRLNPRHANIKRRSTLKANETTLFNELVSKVISNKFKQVVSGRGFLIVGG